MEVRRLPKTRKEAVAKGSRQYFTGLPCVNGHVSPRFTGNKNCVECSRERCRRRTQKGYWQDHGDEAYKEKKRVKAIKYYHSRSHKRAVVKRRKYEKNAQVATEAGAMELRRMRLQARELTFATKIPHEIDHIIPLIHPDICGLTVPVNCVVVTRKQNRAKASRFCAKTQEEELMAMLKKAR